MSNWDPQTWGDEREQRIIMESVVLGYRGMTYAFMLLMLVLMAGGLYLLAGFTALAPLVFSTLPMWIYTRRRGVDTAVAKLRLEKNGRKISILSWRDYALAGIFALAALAIVTLETYLGHPLLSLAPPRHQGQADPSEILANISGGITGLVIGVLIVIGVFRLYYWWARRRLNQEERAEILPEDGQDEGAL